MSNSFDDGKGSTFGRELMSYISSKLPYTGLDVNDVANKLNPKYKYFEDTGSKRAEVLSRHSVSQNFEYNNSAIGSISSNKKYGEIMYANVQKDKFARIRDYRMMSAFAEVANALDEICDDVINIDSGNSSCLKLKTKNIELSEIQQETLKKEFAKFSTHFDFEHKGWSYFRQLLVEGEVYWEHIIHEKYPEEGILGVVQVPTELIDPVFSNVQNVLVKGYLYRKPVFDPKNPMKQTGVEMIPMDKNQITYVHSDIWNETKTMRLPFLENARRAYRQLSMIEDAIIIYRMSRAPERLVFNVDVGNMPAPKAEAYLTKLKNQFWGSKTYDPSQGGIVNKFNPQSILDNFWFAKRAGSEGTNVDRLAGGCLAMDTRIPLLDGRTLNIREIEEELKSNKKIWVYSTNPKNGHITPGLVTWAGVTNERAKVCRLSFDNGKQLICTLDHKFPILGKGFVEAKDLKIGESMIPFNTKTGKLGKGDYEMVYQNDTKTWEFTHRMVANYFKDINEHEEMVYCEKYIGRDKNVIHHKDFNRLNNDPANLAFMNGKDHIILHKNNGFKPMVGTLAAANKLKWMKENDKESYNKFVSRISYNSSKMWKDKTPQERSNIANKISLSIKKYINSSEENKNKKIQWGRNFAKVGHLKLTEKLNSDEEFRKEFYRKQKLGIKNFYKNLKGEERKQFIDNRSAKIINNKNYIEAIKINSKNQTIEFDEKILKFVIDNIIGKTTHEITKHDLCNIINSTPEILNHFLELNKNKKIKNWCGTKISHTHFSSLVKSFGYKTWKQFRKEYQFFNHRLINIEYLSDEIQVGTLTIDNNEKYHDYHTFALECGVFTKNSNLGELDDLMYFVKKLYQSLKVPTTRLDPQDAFRDGSDMLREELKFARFIIRLQQQFSGSLKHSFITHLQMKGLWKEYGLNEQYIDVEFNVPTNFYEMRESQRLEMKVNNYGSMATAEGISPTYAQKKYLGWDDIDIKANREFLRKDKEFKWEITQIENMGPNWKEAMEAQAAAGGAGGEAGGGAEMGAGGGGGGAGPGATPPPFPGGSPEGAAPEAGGGEAAGGAEAPEAGGAPPPEQ